MKVETFESPYQLNSQQIAVPLLDKHQSEEYRRRCLWHGFFVFVLGCLAPIFIPVYTNPRGGLSAHTLGMMLGIFLICVGLTIPHAQLSKRRAEVTFWLFVVSAYTGYTIQVFAAAFGLTQSFVVTARGYSGGPFWMEIAATLGLRMISVFTLVGCFNILLGLRRPKVDTSSASSSLSTTKRVFEKSNNQ
jgi:hydroxylaminobenzene mutase